MIKEKLSFIHTTIIFNLSPRTVHNNTSSEDPKASKEQFVWRISQKFYLSNYWKELENVLQKSLATSSQNLNNMMKLKHLLRLWSELLHIQISKSEGIHVWNLFATWGE